jgi:hypothetical protein
VHVYDHSHVNRKVEIDNIIYINNAFGYTYEKDIVDKELEICEPTSVLLK